MPFASFWQAGLESASHRNSRDIRVDMLAATQTAPSLWPRPVTTARARGAGSGRSPTRWRRRGSMESRLRASASIPSLIGRTGTTRSNGTTVGCGIWYLTGAVGCSGCSSRSMRPAWRRRVSGFGCLHELHRSARHCALSLTGGSTCLSSLENVLVQVARLPGHPCRGELLLQALPASCSPLRPQLWSRHARDDGSGQTRYVAHVDQETGPAVHNGFTGTTHARADDRQPRRHRLQHNERQPLKHRRHDQQVRRTHQRSHVVSRTEEPNPFCKTLGLHLSLQLELERPVTHPEKGGTGALG